MPRPIATGLTKMLSSSIRSCSINALSNVAPPYTTMSFPRCSFNRVTAWTRSPPSSRTFLPATRASVLLNTNFGVSTILRAKPYSGLSGCTASQYLMKPSVMPRPSRMVSLESVIWTMRPITPSSRLRVIQSSCPSGPATNPSTVISTCTLVLRMPEPALVVGLTHAANQPPRNRLGRTRREDRHVPCSNAAATSGNVASLQRELPGVLRIQRGSFRTRVVPTSPEDSMGRPLALFLAATLLASGAAPLAASAPARLLRQQAEARVIGRVVDARTNVPLASVRVSVVGTEISVLTNPDGRYQLLEVGAGTHEVRAQRIGYRSSTQTVDVPVSGAATVDFGLGEEALALEQVVVTGTGSQARLREVGNAIMQINLASVAEPTKSVETLLQARVPGMTVDEGGGTIGQGATIRLRGNVSLSQSNQPLVYVDGVRQTANNYPRNVSQGGSTFNAAQVEASPLADIDPGDIDRVEVIKGAAAATLYGTEAAAGVIEIFTKRGTAGKTAFTVQTDQGINWMRPYGSDVRPLLNMEPWLKKAYGHSEALSVAGGSGQARYYLSSGFDDRDGVLPQDHERRYSLRGNLTLQPLTNLTLQWNSLVSKNDLAMSPDGNSGESIL